MKKEILEILEKEAIKRNQVMRKVKMDDGTIYYTSGELNVKKLANIALTLLTES